jgi:hypothetical protein
MENSNYYIYAYYDEIGVPLYVGLGRGKRWKAHIYTSTLNNDTRPLYKYIRDTFKENKDIHYKIIKENLTREEASLIEEAIVSLLGRKNNNDGILYNLKEGGISAPIEPLLRKVALYDYNSCKLICTFRSINSCSKFIEGNKGTVGDALRGKYPTTTSKGKFFIEDCSEIPNEYTHLKEQLVERKNNRNKNILKSLAVGLIFENVKTKEIKKFETSSQARKYFNGCVKTFYKHIKNNKLYRKEWKIYYDK